MAAKLARLAAAVLMTAGMIGAAQAQKHGGVLHVTHRDNPPSA